MAATRRGTPDALSRSGGRATGPLSERLYTSGFSFDFFQAVRVLQWLEPGRPAIGRAGPPSAEPVRFKALVSLAFPASAVYDLTPPPDGKGVPVLTETFFGLTGPNGVLPRHYTELLQRLDRDQRGPERRALRDWFDLFNHRLLSLFYRAWEKYRFHLAYERGGPDRTEPDTFTLGLLSLIGLGTPSLRGRLRVTGPGPARNPGDRRSLARVDDLSLLHYGGLLAHRPRNADGLRALLRDYFRLDVEILQFKGQWLQLGEPNMSRLGGEEGRNNRLGVDAIAGDRVWEVQSKFCVVLGPLGVERFQTLLPEASPLPGRNAFFLLTHLVRFYVGPELDFDVQLVLKAAEVPECRLPSGDEHGPALGWNSWLLSGPLGADADDAVFPGRVLSRIDDPSALPQSGL